MPSSSDSGNDDLARGGGILKLAMGEGEDVEEKDSNRLLGLAVADSVMDPEVEMLCRGGILRSVSDWPLHAPRRDPDRR